MSIQEKLEQAKNDYREKLHLRLEELGERLSRLRHGSEGADLEGAQLLAHRICGSAGSFGFTAAGEVVKIIDQILLSLKEEQLVPSPAVWDRLDVALVEARRASLPSST